MVVRRHPFIISGSVIKTFNVTDPDSGDNIRIIVTDPTTNDYFSFNQTLGNSIYVEVMLKQKLDRDRVCTRFCLLSHWW